MISALKVATSLLELRFIAPSKGFRPSSRAIFYRAMSLVREEHDMIDIPDSSPPSCESSLEKIVYVQHDPSSDMMTISLQYTANNKSKQFNLYRKSSDTVSSSLERLKLNILKMSKDKKAKKTGIQATQNDLKLNLILRGSSIDTSCTKNAEAWIDGAIFEIDGTPYQIKRNEPQVVVMKLPITMMRGFILLPSVTLSNCEMHNCIFRWFRRISAEEKDNICKSNSYDQSLIVLQEQNYWLKVADGLTYSPTSDDVAHFLKVVCYPSNGSRWGLPYTSLSSRPVELGPLDCPFEKRHQHTREKFAATDKFRFVTYNILADLYADSDYSRSVLFAHCPAYALEIDYRRQLLLKEIQGYNADIVCLQEVDRGEFKRTYEPFFQIVTGHNGLFSSKGGQVAEGVATFYNRERFELIETHKTVLSKLIDPHASGSSVGTDEIVMGDAMPKKEADDDDAVDDPKPDSQNQNELSLHPILKDTKSAEAKELLSKFDLIRAKIQSKENLKRRFLDRFTVLQTSLLSFRDVPNTYVIVANTHLYFAPDADHIRLLQGGICVKYIEYIREYYKKLLVERSICNQAAKISVIFCGDMNSTPDCGLFKLVHQGHVGSDLPDWSSNKEESVEGLELDTTVRFKSAYENIPYTNFTPGFNGCLDYIYYDVDNLACESTVELPDHKDVTAAEGIPSDVFPSDHLALIANLRFLKD